MEHKYKDVKLPIMKMILKSQLEKNDINFLVGINTYFWERVNRIQSCNEIDGKS